MRIITSELGRQIDAYTMESGPIASIDLVKRTSRLISPVDLQVLNDAGRLVAGHCGWK